ncbi:MAG: hypothetical protein PF517_18275 [Salinivirgaceae bacterium]|jgi:hypothetical protein|nr:hypothetical protein [Salinivirgaceae bacterium]
MATKKNKRNINLFKQALLSNTDFINEHEAVKNTKPQEVNVIDDIIESDVREKFKILANFEKVNEKELINKALNHYLRLKGLQLELAMKEK